MFISRRMLPRPRQLHIMMVKGGVKSCSGSQPEASDAQQLLLHDAAIETAQCEEDSERVAVTPGGSHASPSPIMIAIWTVSPWHHRLNVET